MYYCYLLTFIKPFEMDSYAHCPCSVQFICTLKSLHNRNFRWRQWGSSLPGLCMLDPPLGLSLAPVEFILCMFLQSHLQTSSPIPQKSYPKFQNNGTTFQNNAQCSGNGRCPHFFFSWNPNICVT